MPSSVALQVEEHVRQAGFQNSENQQHRVRAAGTSTTSDRQESKRDRTDEDLDADRSTGVNWSNTIWVSAVENPPLKQARISFPTAACRRIYRRGARRWRTSSMTSFSRDAFHQDGKTKVRARSATTSICVSARCCSHSRGEPQRRGTHPYSKVLRERHSLHCGTCALRAKPARAIQSGTPPAERQGPIAIWLGIRGQLC